jgi:hypothetical protein
MRVSAVLPVFLAVVAPVLCAQQPEVEVCVRALYPTGQSASAPRLVVSDTQWIDPGLEVSCVKTAVPVRLSLSTPNPNYMTSYRPGEKLDIVVCKYAPQLSLAGWHMTLASRAQECER